MAIINYVLLITKFGHCQLEQHLSLWCFVLCAVLSKLMEECNKNHDRIIVVSFLSWSILLQILTLGYVLWTDCTVPMYFLVLDLWFLWEKSEESSVSAKESDGWQQRVLLTEIIFLLIGKAICSEVALANNNVRSAAMDICSSVTRCFTLLKLDTHIALSQENRRRCYSRVENYRFVSVCPVPLFSMGIFCPYITR